MRGDIPDTNCYKVAVWFTKLFCVLCRRALLGLAACNMLCILCFHHVHELLLHYDALTTLCRVATHDILLYNISVLFCAARRCFN